jgi:hypothetical protein
MEPSALKAARLVFPSKNQVSPHVMAVKIATIISSHNNPE